MSEKLFIRGLKTASVGGIPKFQTHSHGLWQYGHFLNPTNDSPIVSLVIRIFIDLQYISFYVINVCFVCVFFGYVFSNMDLQGPGCQGGHFYAPLGVQGLGLSSMSNPSGQLSFSLSPAAWVIDFNPSDRQGHGPTLVPVLHWSIRLIKKYTGHGNEWG